MGITRISVPSVIIMRLAPLFSVYALFTVIRIAAVVSTPASAKASDKTMPSRYSMLNPFTLTILKIEYSVDFDLVDVEHRACRFG